MEQIKGKLVRVIYRTPDKGACIACYRDNKGNEFVVTGSRLPENKRMECSFDGDWVTHPKYGRQFKAAFSEEVVGSNRDAIITYLSSGQFKGIGLKTAKKIVEHFGQDTLKILDEDIIRLTEVSGISKKKAKAVAASYIENRIARTAIMEFAKRGLGPKYALKAYELFGKDLVQILNDSPYRLCMVSGITFKTADSFGSHTESYKKDPMRFYYAANYVLSEHEHGKWADMFRDEIAGSTAMKRNHFEAVMCTILNISAGEENLVRQMTEVLIQNRDLAISNSDDGELVMLGGLRNIEYSIASELRRLCQPLDYNQELVLRYISEAERDFKMTLSDEQRCAVVTAFSQGFSLVIGPPGTGKTTVIKTISYVYGRLVNNNKVFAAPSGKAAARMKESSGEQAWTVHKRFRLKVESVNHPVTPQEIVRNSLIIIDEVSMLDVRTASQLLCSIGNDNIVVFCGDEAQLPSVSAGAVLRDMIVSKMLPVTKLRRVYRQDNESVLYANAMAMREGNENLSYGSDFAFAQIDDLGEIENAMIRAYVQKVSEIGIENVMMTAPRKKDSAGVEALNAAAQLAINPPSESKAEVAVRDMVFREGDVVMNLRNSKEGEEPVLVNGDIGRIFAIYEEDGIWYIQAEFSQEDGFITKEYSSQTDLDDLTLAYAYTVHKAQGSQAKCVISCIHKSHSIMLKRNIPYTAVTRASEEVMLFGQEEALKKAIKTEDQTKRRTVLQTALAEAFLEQTKEDVNEICFV